MDNKSDEINTCIGCNQACLDHTFARKTSSCLVNPRACHETELNYLPTTNKKKIAVVGAGPAGLAAATVAAERGHQVDLYEASHQIGGQFNMAKQIPGKEEFYETLRYYKRQIEITGVNLHLNTKADVEKLSNGGYDEVIVATGVSPRQVTFEGANHPKVLSYIEVLRDKKEVGKSVAIVGAGGIGFDVAEYLAHQGESPSLNVKQYLKEWGVDDTYTDGGGLTKPQPEPSPREIYLLQRRTTKVGKNLGKTTGWIHRASLKMKAVKMMRGVQYNKVDDDGLHITLGDEQKVLNVENVIICAGQLPLRDLFEPLKSKGIHVHLIGGADEAAELDAKRAIDQGSRLAAEL